MTHDDGNVRNLVDGIFTAPGLTPPSGLEQRVLRAVQAASRGASALPPGAIHRVREPWPRLDAWVFRGAAVAAIVAIAVGAAAMLRGSSQPTTTHDAPSTPLLGASMLAAFRARDNRIVHGHEVDTNGAKTVQVDIWSEPSVPRPGDRVSTLLRYSTGDGLPVRDVEEIYTEPDSLSKYETVTGELITVSYATRTWSDQKATSFTPEGPSWSDPDAIRASVAAGKWKIVGPTTLNGHKAIQLTMSSGGPKGTDNDLWVDAVTYLPLRLTTRAASGETFQLDYQFLPANAGNEAMLRPVIPGGFVQTPAPPPGKSH